MFLLKTIINYYNQCKIDYNKWNKGISPYTNEPWEFIGKDFHNINHYKDNLNNSISIKTHIDIIL